MVRYSLCTASCRIRKLNSSSAASGLFERSEKKEKVGIGDSSLGSREEICGLVPVLSVEEVGRTTLVRLEEDEFGSYRCM